MARRFKMDEAPEIETVSRSEGISATSAHYQEMRSRGGGKRALKIVLIVVLVLVAVLGITGAVLAMRLRDSAQAVKADAQVVMDSLSGLGDAVKEADAARLQEVSQTVEVGAHNIQDEVNTGLWNFAAGLPVVGQDVKSAQTLADVLVDLADNALVPLSSNTDILELKNIFHDGAVQIDIMKRLISALDDAAPVIARSADTIEALPPARIGQVAEIVDKARERIVQADELLAQAQEFLPYLPPMLGADGQERRYLIVAQNNAELRSCGGLPGSCGILSITDGYFSLGDFASILHEPDVMVDTTDEERAFWQYEFNTDFAQVNIVADFPRVGELSRQYWQIIKGEDVDGVIALDPVFLQHMLALTGGFEAFDGTYIDGGNAAQEILNSVYWRYGYNEDNDSMDSFFSEVAGQSAHNFFGNIGNVNILDFINAVRRDIKEHRLLAWMVRGEEEEILHRLEVDNALGDDISSPELGFFLNDQTWSKMSWYLNLNVDVSAPESHDDGSRSYDVSFTITNTLSDGEAYQAPKYITGYNEDKWSADDILNDVFIIAPAGSTISDIWSDQASYINEYSIYGLQAFRSSIHTTNDAPTSYHLRVTVPSEATKPLTIRATPMAREGALTITYQDGEARE